jgi:hypothetical protein
MKIDVLGCASVGWLCALPQDWPSARGCPPWSSAKRIGRPPAVGTLEPSSGRRPSDVIFPKDVQSDNPDTN